MKLPIRLVYTRYDGWVFAVCKPGSWKPLMLARSWVDAKQLTI